MGMGSAQVPGYQIAGQAQITVEAAKRAVAKGPSAFEDAIGLQMKNIKLSAVKRHEILFLYGQTGLGTFSTAVGVNATTTNVVITLSQWSAALWSGMKNAKIDVYDNGGVYPANTRVGTGSFTVSAVNPTTRQITLTALAADITALNAFVTGNPNNGVAFYGGFYGNEMAGLKKQLTNTGVLFNIDAATQDLWKGNSYAVGAPNALTFKELQKAVAVAVARGLDSEVNVYVSVNTWANLNSDQAALRQYTGGGDTNSTTYKNGAQKLSFASQNGVMNIMPHIYVKEGDAFIVAMEDLQRIGATDITFDLPGTGGGEIFIQLPTQLAVEYRLYSNQTLFLSKPARSVYVSGIIN
jgi:hypothetical protein